MKPATPRGALALLVLVALTPAGARGDMVTFDYSWSFGETYLSAFGQGPITLSSSRSPDGSTFTVDHASGTASLALASPGSSATTPGDNPVAIPVGSFTATASGKPAGEFAFNAGMNLTLRITDASGEAGDLTLVASINGDLSSKNSQLTGNGWTTWGAQTLFLGGHTYTAGFGADATQGVIPDGEPVPFKVEVYIDAGIDIIPIDPIPVEGSPASTPEPSALLLGASAAALCGLRALRRRHVSDLRTK